MGQVKLIGTDGTRYYAFDLSPGSYNVGRRPEAALCIPDKTVSRSHATFEVGTNGDGCFVEDLGSHNGTTLNGIRLTGRVSVKPGDAICFGKAEFKLIRSEDEVPGEFVQRTPEFSDVDIEKSVVLSLNEALKPLPSKVTELPHLFPTLSEMARMLVLPEPRKTMLEKSLSLVSRVIPAERLAVLLVDGSSGDVHTAASLLPSGRDPGKFTLSKTILREILENKNAVLLGDPGRDERFASQESIVQLQLTSAMAVPLFDEDKILGTLYVDTNNPLHRYGDEYLRLLAMFGNIIASRLLNYELLHERQERQLIDAEMQRASAIQKKLLTKKFPAVAKYDISAHQEPCLTVGGDLYDVTVLEDGRLFFVVGDVSGKGLGAALLMSNILASFRILYRTPQFDLVEAVRQTSMQLCDYSAAVDFATVFVGLIDPVKHTLTYINAGHNSPLLVRADGSREYLEATGTMIGAFTFSQWTSKEILFYQDDLLFVYTDGVTEALCGEEQYGESRMEESLSSVRELPTPAICDGFMRELLQFIGDFPRADDITLLLVKRVH